MLEIAVGLRCVPRGCFPISISTAKAPVGPDGELHLQWLINGSENRGSYTVVGTISNANHRLSTGIVYSFNRFHLSKMWPRQR
jgi:hypothetical protein